MSKEEAALIYKENFAGRGAGFNYYYKYTFYYDDSHNGYSINLRFGGSADDIYRCERTAVYVMPDDMEELAENWSFDIGIGPETVYKHHTY